MSWATALRSGLLVTAIFRCAESNSPAYLDYTLTEERACLSSGRVPFANRTFINVDGQDMPVKIWQFAWPSAHSVAEVVKIILEEKLGFHTVHVGNVGASNAAYTALADCEDPVTTGSPCRPQARGSRAHLAFEVWSNYDVSMLAKAESEGWKSILPVRVGYPGGLGYDGIEGMWVGERSVTDGWNQQKLPLQWYQSYDSSIFNPTVFFTDYTTLPNPDQGCDTLGALSMAGGLSDYIAATGDQIPTTTAGGSTYTTCYNNWLPSAACRAAGRVGCIPVITSGGYSLPDMMQWSYWHNMKVIFGSYSWGTYGNIGNSKQTLMYWYKPDVTLLPAQPSQITFPPENSDEIVRGIVKTMKSNTKIWKMMSTIIPGAAPLVDIFMQNFEISMGSVMGMVSNWSSNDPFLAACNFVRQFPQRWSKWVPDRTQCVVGQGLVTDETGQLTCAFCPSGKMSVPHPNMTQSRMCKDCPPGRAQSASGRKDCDPCPIGSFNDGHGARECKFCDIGRYSQDEGQKACTICEFDKTTDAIASSNASQCVCKEGSYLPTGATRCTKCTESMTCPVGGMEANIPASPALAPSGPFPSPAKGFYSTYDEPLSIYRCLDPGVCPGGLPEHCIDNTQDIACGKCLAQHYKISGGRCKECMSFYKDSVFFPALPIIAIPLLVRAVHAISGDDLDKFADPINSMGVVIFIMFQYTQTLGVFGSTESQLTGSARTLTRSSGFFVELSSIVRPECALLQSFSEKYVHEQLIPVYFALLCILTYVVFWPIKRLRMNRDTTISIYGMFFNTFFISIAAESLSAFHCFPHPNGKASLRSAPEELCFDGNWGSYLGLGIVSILLFVLGPFVLFSYIIYIVPKRVSEKSFRMRVKFLLVRYRPRVYWWSLVILGKGLWINIAAIFTELEGQVIWIMLGLLVYVIAVVLAMPWRVSQNCYTDMVSNAALLDVFALSGLFATIDMDAKQSLSSFLSFVMFIPYVAGAALLAFYVKQKLFPAPQTQSSSNKVDQVRYALKMLSHNDEKFGEWFSSLADKDKATVKRAANLFHGVEAPEDDGTVEQKVVEV